MCLKYILLGLIIYCLVACDSGTIQDSPTPIQDTILLDNNPTSPVAIPTSIPPLPKGKKLELWATYYYIPSLEHNENGIPLLDEYKKSLGYQLDSCDWCKAAIEGTALIKKDSSFQLLNFTKRSDELQYNCQQCKRYEHYSGFEKTGKVLWEKAMGFGKGVKNYQLIPFKTVAVDKNIIPLGSALFIPKAKGASYIDDDGQEQVHDGLFFAADVGSLIQGNHIDVFLGFEKQNPFDFISSDSSGIFEAILIENKDTIQQLKRLHLN